MKKKIILLMIISMFTLSLTGCTNYVKDKKGNLVEDPNTGQKLVSNILCRPGEKNIISTYKKNNINVKKLPTCADFTPASGKYNGIWEGLFIKPLSYIIIQIGRILGNYGFAIIVVTILIRLIIFPISKKSAMQSEKI